jgi:outer membrane protein assembly factor BamD
MNRHRIKELLLFCAVALFVSACGSGLPSIPNSPEYTLEKADSYFDRGKYFQAHHLYKAFLERYPGHDRSDWAQFRLAESLYNDDDWAMAAVEYRILVTNYGYSDYADDGYFKEAMCFAAQASDPPQDQSKRYEALDKLERFVQVFRSSPLVPEAEKEIKRNKDILAQKALANALFYLRYKRPKSAEVYLDKIIGSYPDNDSWAIALFHKGKLLMNRGHEDEALEYFARVMAYPNDLDVKDEAAELIRRLKALQPGDAAASNSP